MKASELILELEKLIEKHGDEDVRFAEMPLKMHFIEHASVIVGKWQYPSEGDEPWKIIILHSEPLMYEEK